MSAPTVSRVYTVSPGLTSKPWIFFAGAIALVALAACGFLLALRVRTGPLQLHLTTTLPMIFAVGLFLTGYRFARAPKQVVVGDDGLRIQTSKSENQLSWSDIAWADVQSQAMTNRKLLAIYGNNGKVLLKLPSNLNPFEELAATIKARLTDQPSPHANAVRWRKARRTATALLVGTVMALAGSVWMTWLAYDQRQTEQLMQTHGIDAEGIVVRKFVAPDGRTHRIEYRVAGAGEKAMLHNVEIDKQLWTMLQAGARLPVKTVSGHPEIAKLRAGEIQDDSLNPSMTLQVVLSVGLFLMAMLFLVGAILGFKGIDIATDPATGKLRISRQPRMSS